MEDNKNMFDYLKPRSIETPDSSYFKQLAENVIDSQKTKVIPFYKKRITWITAAAACITILLTIQLTSKSTSGDALHALNSFSSDEIANYITDNIDDFDAELISEFIPISSISPLEYTNRMGIRQQDSNEYMPSDFDNISTEDILEYFDDQNEDLEDLEDLLI